MLQFNISSVALHLNSQTLPENKSLLHPLAESATINSTRQMTKTNTHLDQSIFLFCFFPNERQSVCFNVGGKYYGSLLDNLRCARDVKQVMKLFPHLYLFVIALLRNTHQVIQDQQYNKIQKLLILSFAILFFFCLHLNLHFLFSKLQERKY